MATLPEKYRYVVVEGPIGAGKTSLARMHGRALRRRRRCSKSPTPIRFCRASIEDRARYALPTQLFFLFQRINQVRDLAQSDLFARRHRRRFHARQGPAVRAADA